MDSPLKIVTFNIQAAIGTLALSHYVTRAHRQLFDNNAKQSLLNDISDYISAYDIAFLQEVDLGGRRAGFLCQVDLLSSAAKFADYAVQENRVVRHLSRHGNAILSQHALHDVTDIKLPGRVQGRGAISARIQRHEPVTLVNLHLSLGERDQIIQLDYIADQLDPNENIIVCGDFNCAPTSKPIQRFAKALSLTPLTSNECKTYPSWKPRQALDHILASKGMDSENIKVDEIILSDHRPVTAEVRV
ncbi:MAG: hypothetical protein EX271_11565 [Acidimicrobiales bacterium]|nr:hypothetical protein [Hyphomonadaceae bacterium]RZV37445.1 MAG: hypothetical protein EX271_11565 [Acidimicrobiales bacterium]